MFEVCWQSIQDKTEEPKLCFIKGKPEQLGSAKCYIPQSSLIWKLDARMAQGMVFRPYGRLTLCNLDHHDHLPFSDYSPQLSPAPHHK